MIKILVFDDDLDWLQLIAETFNRAGIVGFLLYEDYKEFIEAVNKDVDICIIDYAVSGSPVNGIELMRQVLAINQTCKVIMMSAFLDLKELNRCVINGAKLALSKDDYFFDDITYAIKEISEAIELEKKLKQQ